MTTLFQSYGLGLKCELLCFGRGQNRVANLLILFKSNINLYTLHRKIANGCHLVSSFPLSLFVLVCAFFLAEEQTGVSRVRL